MTLPDAGRRRALRLLAAALFVAAALRLAGFVVRFGAESVQVDFAAFYTAGEAVSRGLSPYRTHPDAVPPVWDGVDTYRHSRFLYPPLVASLFRPVAALPYAVAKRLWMLVSLACLAYALAASLGALGPGPGATAALALGAFACLYHPLLTLLERGQIDAVTLALLVAAVAPLVRHGRAGLTSGALLAMATLLKLNVVYLVPFLIFRRHWRVLAGYGLGAAGLLLLSLAVTGPRALAEYAQELPRIAAHGEGGDSRLLLPKETLDRLRAGAPAGRAAKDGREYAVESFGFVANASLARVVSARAGGLQRTSAASLAILAVCCAVVWRRERRRRPGHEPVEELAYWQLAFTAVLLSGPLTWTMNTVWLLPGAVLAVHVYRGLADPAAALPLAGLTLGLLLAALPDHHSLAVLVPYGSRLATWKYVAAEAVVLVSLLALPRRRAAAGATSA